MSRIAILQTARLGDIWFTTPLANSLHQGGHSVSVVYDAQYGNPFTYFPSIHPQPVQCRIWLRAKNRWAYALNQGLNQALLLNRLRRQYDRVIWREIFPWRWAGMVKANIPYPDYWYRPFPGMQYRTAATTLKPGNERTILLFKKAQSLRFQMDDAYDRWIEDNLRLLLDATGLKPIFVAFGQEPDHPHYPTWRGSLEEYQQLVARCSIVYGASTSAHVLGQLLGKVVVPLYWLSHRIYNTIGQENARLFFGERLTQDQIAHLLQRLTQSES